MTHLEVRDKLIASAKKKLSEAETAVAVAEKRYLDEAAAATNRKLVELHNTLAMRILERDDAKKKLARMERS